ncbi:MAG TPA: histidine phosphatase family protein [Gemmatimonadales bacterium]|nr:histidine phosphatase family protein [Gemmatimonadales bacterium]
MRLLVIRHAIAGDRDVFAQETGRPDSERPITAEGRKKMREGAAGLRGVASDLAVLGSSPYVRARQTADIVAEAFDGLTVTDVPALASGGSRDGLIAWLNQQHAACVGLVGHEPDLGLLIGWLVTGDDAAPFVNLKKGGACLLELGGPAGPASAELLWVLTPKLLRRLGG